MSNYMHRTIAEREILGVPARPCRDLGSANRERNGCAKRVGSVARWGGYRDILRVLVCAFVLAASFGAAVIQPAAAQQAEVAQQAPSEVSLNPAQFGENTVPGVVSAGEPGMAGAAAVPAQKQPGFGEVLFKMLPMFAMVFLIFYFMVVKPQQQKLKEQASLLETLKKGDTVVTTGGIIARFSGVEGEAVVLELAPNVKARFEPSHIAKRYEPNKASGAGTSIGEKGGDKSDKRKPAA